MKHLISCLALGAVLLMVVTGCAQVATAEPTATAVPETPTSAIPAAVENLHWFGTVAFLYHGSQNIYFDPIGLEGDLPVADIILVSHAHSDHWSVEDLLKVIGPDTTLIISPNLSAAYEQSRDGLGIPATVLAEGESTVVNGVTVEAVPAFDTRFHPRTNGGAGFIVAVDGLRLYNAGGTFSYPEMAQYECDVAMLPMYDMDDLQLMVGLIPAKVFVLMHTSQYTALAVDKLVGADLPDDQLMVALEPGPYQP